MTWRYL